ncbi:MAG: hypothetical protein ACHBMF_07595, partial [Chromatiales bacterium]
DKAWTYRCQLLRTEQCPRCGGTLKIIAAIEHPPLIAKILTHLGLSAESSPILDPGPACLTANRSSRIFSFEEKGPLKSLFPVCPYGQEAIVYGQ